MTKSNIEHFITSVFVVGIFIKNKKKFFFEIFAEKDPYPVDALPTCNHALSVCQHERKCIKLFENFKTHCKVRDNKCRMEDR